MRACVYARVRVRVCVLATLLRVRICACACRPSACVVALKRAWLAVPSHTHARREMSDGMPSCHTVQDVLDGVPRERQEDAHGLRAEKAQVRLRAGGLPDGVFCVFPLCPVPLAARLLASRPTPRWPTPPTSAPGLGSPRPHLHRDWAHPCAHLHRDWAHPCAHLHWDDWVTHIPLECSCAHVASL